MNYNSDGCHDAAFNVICGLAYCVCVCICECVTVFILTLWSFCGG